MSACSHALIQHKPPTLLYLIFLFPLFFLFSSYFLDFHILVFFPPSSSTPNYLPQFTYSLCLLVFLYFPFLYFSFPVSFLLFLFYSYFIFMLFIIQHCIEHLYLHITPYIYPLINSHFHLTSHSIHYCN